MIMPIVSRALPAAPPPNQDGRDPVAVFRAFWGVLARFVARRRGADAKLAARETS